MSTSPQSEAVTAASSKARSFIETTLQQVCEEVSLGEHGNAAVQLRRLEKYEAVVGDDLVSTQFKAKDHAVKYSWPGKTSDEAWRFACAVAILNAIHAAIIAKTAVTKRDIFYSEPELFGDQGVVDRFIDDIAHTCQVPRSALFVTASPKGLFAVPTINDGKPQTIPVSHPPLPTINWILVVEKEASFNTLCENNFHYFHRAGRGIIVTAKGYPDLATRQFLRSCQTSLDDSIPVFGLFDYDAYGIDILKCYRVGSKASAGEANLSLPDLKWIGVKSADIVALSSSAPTIPLSTADKKRAVKLMTSMMTNAGTMMEEMRDCRIELQRMLMLNQKAEIQILEDTLCVWAEQRMIEAMQ